MSEPLTVWMSTVWKKKGRTYRVTQVNPKTDEVYLQCETKGGRSGWKYAPHLPFDYTQVI